MLSLSWKLPLCRPKIQSDKKTLSIATPLTKGQIQGIIALATLILVISSEFSISGLAASAQKLFETLGQRAQLYFFFRVG